MFIWDETHIIKYTRYFHIPNIFTSSDPIGGSKVSPVQASSTIFRQTQMIVSQIYQTVDKYHHSDCETELSWYLENIRLLIWNDPISHTREIPWKPYVLMVTLG